MPATIPIMFELGGGLSRVAQHNFRIPCIKILEDLKLRQQKYEGLFFDEGGTLVAFDGAELEACEGVAIRLEYLEHFLKQNKLLLFWMCKGEKEYFLSSYNSKRSVWSSFSFLNGEGGIVDMWKLKGVDE